MRILSRLTSAAKESSRDAVYSSFGPSTVTVFLMKRMLPNVCAKASLSSVAAS